MNKPSPQQPAIPAKESLRNRLLRPSLGKKFGTALLLFFALTAGNLTVVERLYNGAADTANIINESGRLHYISQEIAFQSMGLTYEKRQDGQVIDRLYAQFEAQLDKIGLAVRQLPPILKDEANNLPGLLRDLHQAWQGYRSVVDSIRNPPEEVDRSLVFSRLGFHSAATLDAADNVVDELTRAAAKAHFKANLIVNVLLAAEVAFMLMIVLYLRHKVILPVRGVSRMFSRFASGDRSARVDFTSRDEIGELAQNFNEAAETVGRLIANLDIGLKVNTALHRAARILQDENRLVAEVMQELVLMLPSAFRNPEKIAARIVYEGETFVTPGFRETPSRLAADFARGGGRQDALEVFRLDACPAGEDAFLEEEQALVKSLGEMLRSYLGRSRAQLSRGRLAAIIEATPDFVGTFMPDGRMLYINAAGRRMLGIGQADDIAGLKLADCYPEWVSTVLARVALPAAARDGIWLGESALLCRDGREIPVSQVVIAHRDENGAVNFVSSIARDIGERIELESRLTRSRDFHPKLFQHFPHMIWRSGIDGNCDYFNKTWLDFTGRKLEEELGDGWMEGVHPDDLDRCRKIYFEAIGRHEPFEIEYRLRRHDGEYRWIMNVGAPYEDLNGDFAGFVGTCDDITERKRYESQLERQANYDDLTGLPNRNLLQDRLSQALIFARRKNRSLAVLFIDLDHFKNINDGLGHDAGDALLALVAARLVGNVREGDTVARQGGDEFVLLLPEIRAEEDVPEITQKLVKAMSAPFDIGGRELHITCSIGIASYPKDGEDRQTLLKNADAAMYSAKKMGRNNAQYYSAEMNVRAMDRLVLENGLHHALERDEFLLHYQPQVDLRSGEIVGMEALVRWQHPELGLISPAMFIPVAEDSGLIVELGEWVLRSACAQNKAWQLAGLKPVSVAVNLSARQFRQPGLVEKVVAILDETGLDPACLELELTESLVMQDVEKTIATLGKLKAMGIKLSIDDFGTGYSSLSYLKRFPIDTLKIDQSFVRDITTDPDDAAIAKSIISMAHDMQLRVIAEGVETEAQKSFLQQRHCDEMQGYLFSRPVPAAEFETLFREAAACS